MKVNFANKQDAPKCKRKSPEDAKEEEEPTPGGSGVSAGAAAAGWTASNFERKVKRKSINVGEREQDNRKAETIRDITDEKRSGKKDRTNKTVTLSKADRIMTNISQIRQQRKRFNERKEKKERWNAVVGKMDDQEKFCLKMEETAKTMRFASRLMKEGAKYGVVHKLGMRDDEAEEARKKKEEKKAAKEKGREARKAEKKRRDAEEGGASVSDAK